MPTPNTTLTVFTIAIPSPLRRLFDYLPEQNTDQHLAQPGSRVLVSFGHQKAVVGILVSISQQSPSYTLKTIDGVLDDEPSLTPEILSLCKWCANYYHYPLGEVCHLALPTLLRKNTPLPKREKLIAWQLSEYGKQQNENDFNRAKKQQQAWQAMKQHSPLLAETAQSLAISRSTINALIAKGIAETIEINDIVAATPESTEPQFALNPQQEQALHTIKFDQFSSYLLDGVTGSGKTEVYLQAISKILAKGQQALILVPEIGLTPQTVSRFQQRFNVPIATLHSGISDKQRALAWHDAKTGNTPIVIGTRSAVFTPLPKLGLIIVDEEHDLSYKQQDGVRYSARDTAIVRAQQQHIPIILGSATPSLETLHNAISGRFSHIHLTERATAAKLPTIECIPSSDDQLAPPIITAIKNTLAKQQQALVFINRRGFAPTLICQDCGWISECHHCDSRMTLHKLSPSRSLLHCHHCDTKTAPPTQCPQCHSRRLQALGQGTQRSEEELKKLFADVPILRIDRDSMNRKGELAAALDIINSQQPCILVGTQMLAKGHHFANVSLAVILGLDSGFFSSDFRGSERMGQLLTQVAGRAGRETHQGTVLLQTQFSDHPLLRTLIDKGYSALSQQILNERRLCDMPPYRYLALLRCHAQQASIAIQFLHHARQQCENILKSSTSTQYLGPLPATIEKRNNRYYYYLQIKTQKRSDLHSLLQPLCALLEKQRTPKGLHWLIDVDPQET